MCHYPIGRSLARQLSLQAYTKSDNDDLSLSGQHSDEKPTLNPPILILGHQHITVLSQYITTIQKGVK
ncbi:hypothetical protein AMATHDRAFT_70592 [Amanita thiersii Skay4041]|uniref:Uncharacterized protein n=1 Tax=Amanita thiersii Skay4041 TaxID=703135 RepID=A0A2A9ND04_9AGAR|nr:hypothetical protein AMATHDRAFT_70592 [Amanita thiersii Skay4041]